MNNYGVGPVWAARKVLIENYFVLEGRATRSEYWWFLFAYGLAALLVGLVCGVLGTAFQFDSVQAARSISFLMALLCLPALLGLWVRRCRDIGRSRLEAITGFLLLLSYSAYAGTLSDPSILSFSVPSWMMNTLLFFSWVYSLYVGLTKSTLD